MVFLISLAVFLLLALTIPAGTKDYTPFAPYLAVVFLVVLVSGLREVYLWFTGRGPLVRRAERRQRRASASRP
jgi:hypothetical protein